MYKKLQKKFFDFEIIAFELFALETRLRENIFMRYQYVNKQSQDFGYN